MKKEIGLKIFAKIIAFIIFLGASINFANAAAPLVSNVVVNNITAHGARIAWKVQSVSNVKILYGTSSAYGQTMEILNPYGDDYHWWLNGLAPATTYYFCIKATNSLGESNDCSVSTNRYSFVTSSGSSEPVLPTPPQNVDTTMPSFGGVEHRVSPDCSNFQSLINQAQGGDKIVLPKGTVCTGQYTFPAKSGSSWIHVTTDGNLPAPGIRITPAFESEMATIRTNRPFINHRVYAGSTVGGNCQANSGGYGDLYGQQLQSYVDEFDLGGCKTDGSVALYPYTSGTVVPNTCIEGAWFKKTDGPLANKMYLCTRDGGVLKYLPIYTNAQGSFDSSAAIRFDSGAHHYRFSGIKVTTIPVPQSFGGNFYPGLNFAILVYQGSKTNNNIVFDRTIIKMDEPAETTHAVEFEGSNVAIIDSWMEGILDRSNAPSAGGASAIWTSVGPGPGKIHNNYISAPGISIFFTSDSGPHNAPMTDYTITNNYIYKDVEKYRFGGSRHNGSTFYPNRHSIELKAGKRMHISGNIIDGNWGSVQQGAMIGLSPRPSFVSGIYPDNTLGISDINISNNILKNSPIMVYVIGHNDGSYPGQPEVSSRISITNNLVQGINGGLYDNGGTYCSPVQGACTGSFIWSFLGGEDLIVRHNTVDTFNGAFLSFVSDSDQKYGSMLKFTDNIVPMKNNSTYDSNGIVIGSFDWGQSALDRTWKNGANPGWQFNKNVIYGNSNPIHPLYNAPYPVGNTWLSDKNAVGFASDFSLLSTSPVKNTASDGTDPGINIATLNSATAGTLSGNPGVSNPPIDNTPPVIYGILVSGATSTSANVTWLTNENSDSLVEYGLTTSYGSTSGLASSLVSNHSVSLSSLSTQTSYHFRVKSRDSAGNLAVSADQVFTTGSIVPPPPPVTLTCPAAGNNTFTTCHYNGMSFDSLVATTSVPNINFDWGTGSPVPTVNADQFSSRFNGDFDFEAADYSFTVTSDDGVRLFVDGVAIVDKWIDQASITYTVNKTLTAGKHNVKLEFYENAWDAKIQLSWVKKTIVDSTPPIISSLSSFNITQTTAIVSWATNELSTATLYYGTASDNKTDLATSFVSSLTGLIPNTAYSYYVVAKDAFGNTSTSTVQSFTTLAPVVDVTPPVISSVNAKPNRKTLIISWMTNEPADTQVEYGLANTLGSQTPLVAILSTTHSVSLKNLTQNTTYYFRVKSKDSSGNLSVSSIYTILTKQGQTPLPAGVALGDTVQFAGDPTIYVAQEDGLYGFDSYKSFQNYTKASDTTAVKQQPTIDVATKQDLVATDILAKEVLAQDIVLLEPTSIQPIVETPKENSLYKLGTLVNDNGTIYLIIGQNKIPFTSMSVFNSLGYNLNYVVKGSTSGYALAQTYKLDSQTMAHPWTSWLRDGKTIYYSSEQGMIPVPSMEIFQNNGGVLDSVLPMNQADRSTLKLELMTLVDPRIAR